MTFTRRERLIIAVAAVAVALLVLDAYALSPLLDRRRALEARKTRLTAEMERAGALLDRRKLIGPRWRRMIADGMKRDPVSQLLHAMRNWSADAGLDLSSLRPERPTEDSPLPEINVHVAATGSMAAVSRFCWKLETADIPIKIKVLQIRSRKDGLDDLSMQVQVSTLYLPARPTSPGAAPDRAMPAGGGR